MKGVQVLREQENIKTKITRNVEKATPSTFSFKDLTVWKKAVAFAKNVIKTIDTLEAPRNHFRLIEQLEAACTSVAMNIAEGKGRQTTKEYIQFLYIARGSLFEVVTLLVILNGMDWVEDKRLKLLETEAEEITKMLNALIKSLKSRTVTPVSKRGA